MEPGAPGEKFERLTRLIAGMEGALVAFSGGVDSTLLLAAAQRALGDRALALTVSSLLSPPGETQRAHELARLIGARHLVREFDALGMEPVAANAPDRCYHCKKAMTGLWRAEARSQGLERVLEGSNAQDARAHRPGLKALAEAGVSSPLMETGLTKAEVRALVRELGLPNWNQPASPCLATRFEYGVRLSAGAVAQVAAAEKLLASLGFEGVRARRHGGLLRLEAPERFLAGLTRDETLAKLRPGLKELGFTFITLDLEGYRQGVYDPAPAQDG